MFKIFLILFLIFFNLRTFADCLDRPREFVNSLRGTICVGDPVKIASTHIESVHGLSSSGTTVIDRDSNLKKGTILEILSEPQDEYLNEYDENSKSNDNKIPIIKVRLEDGQILRKKLTDLAFLKAGLCVMTYDFDEQKYLDLADTCIGKKGRGRKDNKPVPFTVTSIKLSTTSERPDAFGLFEGKSREEIVVPIFDSKFIKTGLISEFGFCSTHNTNKADNYLRECAQEKALKEIKIKCGLYTDGTGKIEDLKWEESINDCGKIAPGYFWLPTKSCQGRSSARCIVR